MTALRFVVRTPREVVLEDDTRAVRVPTETGQVGLRPRGEPVVLGVEPGLVAVHRAAGTLFVATAGGLLEHGRDACTLYTPFAIAGADADQVVAALERALAMPEGDLAARRQLGQLEQRIIGELRPPEVRTKRRST